MVALVRQETGPIAENADWEASEIQQDCLKRLEDGRFPGSVQAVAQASEAGNKRCLALSDSQLMQPLGMLRPITT